MMHKVDGGGVPRGLPCTTFVVVPGGVAWVQRVTVYIMTIISVRPCAQKWTGKPTVDTPEGAAIIPYHESIKCQAVAVRQSLRSCRATGGVCGLRSLFIRLPCDGWTTCVRSSGPIEGGWSTRWLRRLTRAIGMAGCAVSPAARARSTGRICPRCCEWRAGCRDRLGTGRIRRSLEGQPLNACW